MINHWFRRLAILALAVGTLFAVDWKALKYQGYVNDFANVVDAQSRAALEAYCTAVEQSTGAQVAFVTLPSLQGEPIEEVANAIFNAWGVGAKGKNNGILLLLSVGDRRNWLEVGYGLESIIPDGFAGQVLDEMRPALRAQQYGEALMAAGQTIGSTIAKAKGVNINAQLPRRIRRSPAHLHPLADDPGRHFHPLLAHSCRRPRGRLWRRRRRRLLAWPHPGQYDGTIHLGQPR